MSAGGALRGGGGPAPRGVEPPARWAVSAPPRDPWVDPCIRRKLTTNERLNLRHLTDHLERLNRRMERCAARHWETI